MQVKIMGKENVQLAQQAKYDEIYEIGGCQPSQFQSDLNLVVWARGSLRLKHLGIQQVLSFQNSKIH